MLISLSHVRRLLSAFFFLTLFFTVTGSAKAQEQRTVRVGGYQNKPKIYQDMDRQPAGLFADVINFVAKKEDWRLEYVFGSWEEGLARLENGEIDIMVDVAVTPQRREKYDFTNETVFSSWGVVYAQKDSEIDSFLDLDGKKIAILKSSVYLGGPEGADQYIKSFGLNAMFVEVDEYAQVFDLLNTGDVDAAIVSRVFGLTNEKNYPNLKATDLFFSPTELRFALTKGDPDNPYLVEKIDYWVKLLKDGHEGYYQQSLRKHGLTGLQEQVEIVPSWLYPTIGGLLGILLVLLTAYFFKKQAKKKIIKKLKQEGLLIRKIFGQASIIVFATNPFGNLVLIEAIGGKRSDIDGQSLIGESIFEVLKESKLATDQATKALSGKDTKFKANLWGKNWQFHISPVNQGEFVQMVVGVAMDTNRK